MTITFFLEDFRKEKIEFLEIGPFRKMAITFFFKRYQLDFLQKFSSYKSQIFQKEII